MKNTLPAAILVMILLLSGVGYAQGSLPAPAAPLTNISTVQANIDELEPTINYNSLRRRRYGWVYPGRWEVGLHLMPWIYTDSGFARILSEQEENSGGSTIIDLGDGDSRTVFLQRFEFFSNGKRPRVVFLNLDAARQLASGWRFGFSYTLFSGVPTRELGVEELTELIEPGEYAVTVGSRQWQSFLSAEAGFTFRRRRRLRPSLSLAAVRAGDSFRKSSSTLVDGEDGSVLNQISGVTQNENSFRSVYLLSRFSLQYQLSLHATLGLDVGVPLNASTYVGVPLFGIGGRYVFSGGM